MKVLETIREKLRKYPDVEFNLDNQHVEIFSKDESGFPVALYLNDQGCTVVFHGWHAFSGFNGAEDQCPGVVAVKMRAGDAV